MINSKIFRNVLLSVVFSLSFLHPSFAEDMEDETEIVMPPAANYKGLGMTAGFMSGLGFTYRHFFADQFGVKATGIGFFDRNQAFGNIGLQGMVIISENDWLRFYALAGISNFTTKRSYQSYTEPYPATPSVDENEYNSVVIPPRNSSNLEMLNNVGAGIGIELGRQALGLSLALELPLVLSFRNREFNFLYPIPQVSLIYNF